MISYVEKEKDTTLPDIKSFDLYQHLKINVKEHERNCKDEIDNSNCVAYYCISCKKSICNMCTYEQHKAHFLLKKSDFLMNIDVIEIIFKGLEGEVNKIKFFSENKKAMEGLVNEEFDLLQKKLEHFREIKLKELSSMFDKNDSNFTAVTKGIEDTKRNILKFFEKNEQFLNYDNYNNDKENTIFLVVFEMLNLCIQKNKEIVENFDKLKRENEKFENMIKERREVMIKNLENLMKDENDDMDHLHPRHAINTAFEKLNEDHYKEIKVRISKYNEHFENFKSLTFETVNKAGSLKEIEKILNLFDKKNEKGIAFIFNHALPNKNEPVSNSVSPSSKGKGIKTAAANDFKLSPAKEEGSILDTKANENERLMTNESKVYRFKHKNEVVLDNPIINRYFSYSTLDTVNKNFRIRTNAGQTSFAYLNIKPEMEQEEEADTVKPISGTNEIHIYDRKKRKLIKKKLKLDKIMHGYNVFLDGHRSMLVNDKLYITGGRDEDQDYNVVLTFDIKEYTLKRTSEMRFPRSYHSIEYNDLFKTLIVLGGRKNKTCELYDMFTNRWLPLPELNSPRANMGIYFDKEENNIYALFGLKGDITEIHNISDEIEMLELQSMAKGWTKIDYENKSQLDFRNNICKFMPVTRNKLLIHGANVSRNTVKSLAVFMLDRKEIIPVNNKLYEEIRGQARKSTQLSKIFSTMSNLNK